MSHTRNAASHQPSPRKRTLQVRLGRPKPPSDSAYPSDEGEKAALRISLKRKPSLSEQRPPRYMTEDDDEEAVDDDDESANGFEDDEDDEDDDGEEYQVEQPEDAAGPSVPRTTASTASRRPIKKLRAKGLYDALPKLIDNLIRRDSYKFFCEPVNPEEVPGYLDVIQEPMDFGTMQQKVEARQYSHMDQFKAHFALVIRNAQTFNPPGSLYYNEAKRLGSWGTKAIEREGMAVNDNGRAGVKAQQSRRAGPVLPPLDQIAATAEHVEARSSPGPTRYSLNVGIEAVMSAARLKPHARQRAAAALGLTAGSLLGRGSTQPMDVDDEDGIKAEDDDLDDDDSDDDRNDARASVMRDSRERSQTLDVGGSSNRFCSSQPGGTPSTPVGRQASPDALRKRLAAVTGMPMQAVSSPLAALGPTKPSKHFKAKHRLSVPGTPKRLAANRSATGSATPILIGEQTAAALAQFASTQSSAPVYTFDDDGSINPDSIEDLQSYLAMQSGSRPILMPTVESLHPVAFVPNEYSGKVTTGKAGDDADDDDDDDGKGDSKDKGDKDPLASLPTPRPGAPDALYAAVAPDAEELSSNFSHDLDALPPNLRNLPFYVPSGQALRSRHQPGRVPSSWINDAYEEALRNDRKPKKQRDREREKEREMLDDWTYFRPRLARMLELSDLGPMSMLTTQNVDGQHPLSTDLLAPHRLAQLRTDLEKKASGTTSASRVRDVYLNAVRQSRSLAASEKQVLGQAGSDIVGDLVYGGVMGKAYCRSLAEFVAGAVTSPFLTDEVDDARGRAQQAYEDRLDAVIRALAEEVQARPTELDGKIKEMGSRRGPFMWRDTSEEVASPAEEVPEETRSPTPEPVLDEPAAVEPELQPLDCGLVQLVEESIVKRLTGSTVDVLHLVAAHLNANGCSLDADEVLQRLDTMHAHPLDGTAPPGSLPFTAELSWLKDDSSLAKLLDEARQDIDSLGSIIKYVVSNA